MLLLFVGDGFSHRRAKSLKESRRSYNLKFSPSHDPLSVTLSSLDLSKGQGHQSPRSPRPNSSLTRTMRWLQRQPSPMSLDSSTSSLKDGSSSGDSVVEESSASHTCNLAHLASNHDCGAACESVATTGSHMDEDACASLTTQHHSSPPIIIQHPLSREPSKLLRRRIASRGQHPSDSPPFPLPPFPRVGASMGYSPPQMSPLARSEAPYLEFEK